MEGSGSIYFHETVPSGLLSFVVCIGETTSGKLFATWPKEEV